MIMGNSTNQLIRESLCAPRSRGLRPATRLASCGVAVLLSLFAMAAADTANAAEKLYTAEISPSGSHLATVDPTTGAILHQFPNQGGVIIDGIAYDSSTDTLFGFDGGDGLYSLDRLSGAYTPVGSGSPVNIAGLAIQPTTFDLFGISINGGSLWSIDKTTGAATLIGPPIGSLTFGHGLAFAPDGTLYATDTSGAGTSSLYTLDLLTGDAVLVGEIDRDVVVGLTFNASGVLFGSDNGTNSLITIDRFTGVANTVGFYGGSKHNAIEFVPEPTTLLLLAAGAAATLRRRKQFK